MFDLNAGYGRLGYERLHQLVRLEMQLDFLPRRIGSIRCMNQVSKPLQRVVAPDRSRRGLVRTRGPNERPHHRNRLWALEHRGHDGTTGQMLHQAVEESWFHSDPLSEEEVFRRFMQQ